MDKRYIGNGLYVEFGANGLVVTDQYGRKPRPHYGPSGSSIGQVFVGMGPFNAILQYMQDVRGEQRQNEILNAETGKEKSCTETKTENRSSSQN